MEKRIYNFSAGPCTLPDEVMLQAQEDLYSYKGCGMSVMEMSHRSKEYDQIHKEAEADLRQLLNISDDYAVMFIQGGATLQFSMIPLNLMNKKADYIITGAWAKKAVAEAKKIGTVNIAGTTAEQNFNCLPKQDELNLDPEASYVHFTSNNTIFGTEYHAEPEVGNVPLVCDASSNILSKKIDVSKYGILYAGAQKNMGPAGCALTIIKKDLLDKCSENTPTYLNFKTHADAGSLYNTPPTFTIYIMGLVYKWLLKNGGLDAIEKQNIEKANMLYNYIEESDGYYKGTAVKQDRSFMNVTFCTPNEDLDKKLIAETTAKNFSGLKGHRSVGGLRASIYNAFPTQGVADLVQFMKDFKANN